MREDVVRHKKKKTCNYEIHVSTLRKTRQIHTSVELTTVPYIESIF